MLSWLVIFYRSSDQGMGRGCGKDERRPARKAGVAPHPSRASTLQLQTCTDIVDKTIPSLPMLLQVCPPDYAYGARGAGCAAN